MMNDLISRNTAIDYITRALPDWSEDKEVAIDCLSNLPSVEPDRWNRLIMYLADLQLTYSLNWGANGCGDEKLYEFVTGLIEELRRWDREEDSDEQTD